MKQKLNLTKLMVIMLLLFTVLITGCKKDNTAPEEEKITTNDPRLLGKWSNTSNISSSSSLISIYEFKADQVVTQALVAQSNLSGLTVISEYTFKWTTTNNNTVTIQSIGSTSVSKYVVEGKKLLFTDSNNTQVEYIKFE